LITISFDYGDTITQAPETFRKWAEAIHKAGGKVYMLTGVRYGDDGQPLPKERKKRKSWAKTLSFPIEIIYVIHDRAQLSAKAQKCKELGIDIHVDNNPKVLKSIRKSTDTLPILVGEHALKRC